MAKVCTIRKDLLSENLAVPIGGSYYDSDKPLPYRWNKDKFEILFNGEWQEAESADFEF